MQVVILYVSEVAQVEYIISFSKTLPMDWQKASTQMNIRPPKKNLIWPKFLFGEQSSKQNEKNEHC